MNIKMKIYNTYKCKENEYKYMKNTLNYIKSTLKWINYTQILVKKYIQCKYVLTNYE